MPRRCCAVRKTLSQPAQRGCHAESAHCVHNYVFVRGPMASQYPEDVRGLDNELRSFAFSANVASSCVSSRMARVRSAAIGALSCSLLLFRVFTVKPFVPSNNNPAVTTPWGFSLRIAPSDATMGSKYLSLARYSVIGITCPLRDWSCTIQKTLSISLSVVRAFQLKSIRGSRSFSDSGRDNQ